MNQDINKIIDFLSNEWANDAVLLRKRIAILLEENERLKAKIEELKKGESEEE